MWKEEEYFHQEQKRLTQHDDAVGGYWRAQPVKTGLGYRFLKMFIQLYSEASYLV